MMMALLATWEKPSIPIVAIIEDDDTERYLLSEQLRGWGYQPEIFEGGYKDVDSLLIEVTARKADFVICDNHLQQAGYACFFGTEAVALFLKAGIPSILVTQHQDSDDLRLKKWRPSLPVILDKGEIDQEQVAQAFNKCSAEVKNFPAEDRRPYRVLVDVDSVEGNEVIAFVDAWNPHISVSFPYDLVAHLGAPIKEGTFLLAEINIGTSQRRDLYFKNFELAPEPDPYDGLA